MKHWNAKVHTPIIIENTCSKANNYQEFQKGSEKASLQKENKHTCMKTKSLEFYTNYWSCHLGWQAYEYDI